MARFVLTAAANNFVGQPGQFNLFYFTPSTLQAADTVTGGATGVFIDDGILTAGGVVSAAQFGGVSGLEELDLASGGNSVALPDALVSGSSTGFLTVVDSNSSGWTAALSGDVDGDGKADLVWRRADGTVAIDPAAGDPNALATPSGGGASDWYALGNEWSIKGLADFNGDGKADLLWRNGTDGTVAQWQLNGTQIQANALLGAVGLEWNVAATGDFGGDGKSDILWRNSTTGMVAEWQMNGSQVADNSAIGQVGNEWHVVGAADFNGDHNSDVLWRADDGTVAIWQMNGSQIAVDSALGNVGNEWHIVATADFNGDGKADILWRADDGMLAEWQMNGTQIASNFVFGMVGQEWQIVSTGDYDGDGKADILWRNSNDGTVVVWNLNGNQVQSQQVVTGGNDTIDASAAVNGSVHAYIGTGSDTVIGGALADQIFTPNSNFASIDGGGGNDRLVLTTPGQVFNLTANATKIHNTEVLWLADTANTNVTLAGGDIPQVSGSFNYLYIVGGPDDHVEAGDQWGTVASNVINAAIAPGHTFTEYVHVNGSLLFVDSTINLSIMAGPTVPVDANAAANSVAENVSNGTAVGITASSVDASGAPVTYSLIDNAGGRFAINASTGVVTVADASLIDFESAPGHAYTITAQAAAGIGSSSQIFTINVIDVAPTTPVDGNGATGGSIAEDVLNGAAVGITVASSDVHGGTLSFSLTDDAGGRFAIDSSTGVVTVANAALIDFENSGAGHSFTITAQASDGTLTSAQNFTIAVTDVAPSTPIDGDGANGGSISEGAANNDTVGVTASSTDPHGGQVTYSLTDNAGGRFAIDSSTGVVTVANAALLNFESATSHQITVKAADSSGLFTTQNFTIALTDVAPSVSIDGNATADGVAEDAAIGTAVGITASSTDVHGGTVTYALTDNAGGRFAINSASGIVTVASAAVNFEDNISHAYTITVQASDGTLTSTQDFVVPVFDVTPTSPIDSDNATNTVVEGATTGALVGVTAASTDVHGGTVTYRFFESSPGVFADGGGRFQINSGTGVVSVSAAGAASIDYETAPGHTYSVTVQAFDGTLPVNTQSPLSTSTYAIGVTNAAPEAPVDSDTTDTLTPNTVTEGAANNTYFGLTAHSIDPAGTAITYSLLDTLGGRFAINATTGAVTTGANSNLIDFEASGGTAVTNGSYTLTVIASDNSGAGNSTSSQSFTITVANANPQTPTDGNPGAANTVAEGVAAGQLTGLTVASSDPGTGPALSYTLTDDAGGRFQILDSSTGVVTTGPNANLIDFELSGGSYQINAQASDGQGGISTQTFDILVTDVAPSSWSDANTGNNTVVENAANDTAVGITAHADDVNGGTVVYSFATTADSANGAFKVDASSGVVSVADHSLIDFESTAGHQYSILVTASTVGGTATSTQGFVIDVTDVAPFAPTDTDAAGDNGAISGSVAEGTAGAATDIVTNRVGITAHSTDINGGNITYSLNGGGGGLFDIDSSTGVVFVKSGAVLDYESTGPGHTFAITVDASDGTQTSSQIFSIAITNVAPSQPTDTDGATNSIAADAADNTPAGITLASTDPNTGAVTYSLTGAVFNGNPITNPFQVDASSGVVSLAPGHVDLTPYEAGFITITAVAQDSSLATSTSQTFDIFVANNQLNVDLDADDSPANANPGNSFSNTFTEQGAAVSIADTDVAITNTGNPGVADALSATIVLTNAQLGDALTISGGLPAGITSTTATAFSPTTHQVTITVSLTGTATYAAYQTAIEQIRFSTTGDPTGDAPNTTNRLINVTVTDSTGTSSAASSTIHITPLNDAPILLSNGSPSSIDYTENALATALLANATITDPDNPANFSGGTFTVAITANAAANDQIVLLGGTLFSVNGTTLLHDGNAVGTINGLGTTSASVTAFTAAATPTVVNELAHAFGFQNSSDNPAVALDRTVTFTFEDGGQTGGGALSSNTVTQVVQVIAVDDAPTAVADTATIAEDSGANAIDVLANDTDPDGGPKSVTAKTDGAHGGVVITGGGTGLTYQPDADFFGSDSFTYTLNGGSSTTVTVTITAVNDAPAGAGHTVSATEDTAYQFTAADFGFTDPNDTPANSLAAVKITQLPGAGTLTDNGVAVTLNQFVSVSDINHGLLMFRAAADASGAAYTTFKFAVQDDGGTANSGVNLDQSPKTMTIDVSAVDDAPVAQDGSTSGPENTPITGTATATDVDNNVATELTYSVVGTNGGASHGTVNFTNATTGAFTYTPDADFIGSDSFTYHVSDGTLTGNTATIAVSVTATNTLPTAVDDTASATEDTTLVIPFATLLANDSAGPANESDQMLTITAVNGATGGTATIHGSEIWFTPTADSASGGSFTYTIQDSAGASSVTDGSVTVNISAVNDAPVNQVPSPQTAIENTDTDLTSNPIQISDVDDDGSANYTVTLSVLHGILNVAALGVTVTTNGTASVTLTGTTLAINATLSTAGGLVYHPANNYTGPDTLTVLTDDGGASGAGGAKQDTDVVPIQVYTSPILLDLDDNNSTAPGTAYSALDTAPATPVAIADGDVTIINPIDGSTLNITSATIAITANAQAGDLLTFTPNLATTGDILAASGSTPTSIHLTSAGGATTDQWDAALHAVTYTTASGNTGDRTISVSVTDGIDTSNTAQSTVYFHTLDLDTTALNNGTGFSTTFAEGGSPVAITDPSVVVTDPDHPTAITAATVQITGNYNDAQDVLAFTPGVTDVADITAGTFNTTTGTLQLTSLLGATEAQWQAALAAVTYENTSLDPTVQDIFSTVPDRTISVSVSDGTFNTNTAQTTLTISTVDDLPVAVADSGAGLTTAEDTTLVIPISLLTANDTDAEHLQLLTIDGSNLSGATHGTVQVNPNNAAEILFTPDANYNGSAGFDYKVSDDGGNDSVSSAHVTINVTAVNDAPVITAATLTAIAEDPISPAPAGAMIASLFTGHFTDPDTSSSLAGIAVSANNANATTEGKWQYSVDGTTWHDIGAVSNSSALALSAATELRFLPIADYNGTPLPLSVYGLDNTFAPPFTTDTTPSLIDASVNGGSTAISDATTTISTSVTEVNDPVTAGADTVTATEDTTLVIPFATLLANDSAGPANESGQTLAVSLTGAQIAAATGGTVSVHGNEIWFTPTADLNGLGIGGFDYTVTDNGTTNGVLAAQSTTAHVTVDINAVDDAPVAQNGTASGNEDNPITGSAVATDVDNTQPQLTYSLVGSNGGAAHGTVSMGTDGSYTYTPASNFFGTDTFQFNATDLGPLTSNNGTITVTVNAQNDVPALDLDANDSGANGATGLTGADFAVNYTVSGSAAAIADIDTTITDVDNTNIASAHVVLTNAQTNDVLAISGALPTGITATVTPGVGTITVDLSGSASLAAYQTALHQIVFNNPLASPDATGDRAITVTVNDGTGNSNTANTTIHVTQDGAPVASNDSGSGLKDAGNITGNAIVGSDTDAQDPTSALVVTAFRTGTEAAGTGTSGVVGNALVGQFGALTLNFDGTYTYQIDINNSSVKTLTSGNQLDDVFTYTVTDTAGRSDQAQITIQIDGTNTAPTANPDAVSATEAGGVSNGSAGVDPSGNVITDAGPGQDSDPDSDTLTVTAVNGSAANVGVAIATASNFGTLKIDSDGHYLYTVNQANTTVQALRTFAQTLTDTFNYTINDGTPGHDSTAQVTVTIHGQDDNPVANPNSASATEAGGTANGTVGTNPSGNVLTGAGGIDTDVDSVANGEVLTVQGVEHNGALTDIVTTGVAAPISGDFGALTLNSNGSYTYAVDNTGANVNVEALNVSGGTGTDTFTYTIHDADGLTSTSTLTITVLGQNDAPVAVADGTAAAPAYIVQESTALTVNAASGVRANDTDVDNLNSSLTATVNTQPAHGTLSGNVIGADGSFTYTPTAGYLGGDSFTYHVTDPGALNSTPATVFIDVQPHVAFIDNTGGGTGGTGTQADPFKTIADFNTANTAGNHFDIVYLEKGTGTYDTADGVNLRDGQVLLGQGVDLTYTTSASAPGGAHSVTLLDTDNSGAPTIHLTAAGQGVTLAQNNTLQGFHIDTGTQTGAIGIEDSNLAGTAGTVGTLNVANVDITGAGKAIDIDQGGALNVTLSSLTSSGSSTQGVQLSGVTGSALTGAFSAATGAISGSTGTGFLVGDGAGTATTGGTATITYGGTISTTGTARAVDIQDHATGAVTLSGNISHTGGNATAIFLDQDTSNFTFSGNASTLNSGTANALSITNQTSGTVNFSHAVDIDTTSGTGVNLSGNTGSTINFAGGNLTIDTTTGTGFTANSGVITVQGSGNHIVTTTGTGLNLSNLTVGNGNLNGVQFDAISVNGAANGILLSNVAQGANSTGIDVLGGTIAGVTTRGVDIDSTSADVAIASSITTNGTSNSAGSGTGRSVEVTGSGANRAGGSIISFSGAIDDRGTGINLDNNDQNTNGAIVTFSGGLNIDTSSSTAFNATNGGTVNVTGSLNSLNATGATALKVIDTTIGSSNLVFHDISSGAASAAGIILDNTGSSGGLHVTGSGATIGASGGGVIAGKTGGDITSVNTDGTQNITGTNGVGIFLRSTNDVQLNGMQLNDFSNFGILGSSVTGLALNHMNLSGSNGDNSNIVESSVWFQQLTGSGLTVDNSTFGGGLVRNFNIINTSGTLNRITFTGDTFGKDSASLGSDALFIQGRNSATINATVTGSTFQGSRGDMLQFDLTDTATGNLQLLNSQLNNTEASVVGGGGVTLSGGGSTSAAPTLTYTITGNTFSGARGDMLLVVMQTGHGSAVGTIANNTFGNAAINGSGSSEGSDIDIRTVGGAAQTVLINNNQIHQYSNSGIVLQVGDQNVVGTPGAPGALNATVTNNTVDTPNPASASTRSGIHLNAGTTSGDTYQVYLNLYNNNAPNTGSTDTGAGSDYLIRERQNTTVHLSANGVSYSGGNTDIAAVAAFVQANNIGTETVFVATPAVGAPGYVGGTPSLPLTAASGQGLGAAATLTLSQLMPILTAAIDHWVAAGAAPEQIALLNAVHFNIADLSNGSLATESDQGITIDVNGAGWGWFIDPTPADNSEFATVHSTTELVAAAGDAAQHMDLLTVVEHELGHAMGLEHTDVPGDVMDATLEVGTRRLPDASDVADAQMIALAQSAAAAEAALPVGAAAPDGTPIAPGTPGDDIFHISMGGTLDVGGAGADTFVFDQQLLTAPVGPVTHIADYGAAQGDIIDVSALISARPMLPLPLGALVQVHEDASDRFATLAVNVDLAHGQWVDIAQLDGVHAGDVVNVVIDPNQQAHQFHADWLA